MFFTYGHPVRAGGWGLSVCLVEEEKKRESEEVRLVEMIEKAVRAASEQVQQPVMGKEELRAFIAEQMKARE